MIENSKSFNLGLGPGGVRTLVASMIKCICIRFELICASTHGRIGTLADLHRFLFRKRNLFRHVDNLRENNIV